MLIFFETLQLLKRITKNKAIENCNQIYFHEDTEFLNNL